MTDDLPLGATGQYPDGKLNDSDRGELAVIISSKDGIVRIDFGTELSWVAMKADQAVGLAMQLIGHARDSR